MKSYDPPVLLKLCAAIREEADAQQWLVDAGYQELSEFWDAYQNIEKSFKWLLTNNYRELAALVDGLHGDENAKAFLVKSGHRELAAVIDAAEGNKTALLWLTKFNHKAWIAVAREIYLWNKKNEPKGIWKIFSFGNPFR